MSQTDATLAIAQPLVWSAKNYLMIL